MIQRPFNINDSSLDEWLNQLSRYFPDTLYNDTKHRVELKNQNFDVVGYVRLPPQVRVDFSLENSTTHEATLIWLAIASGSAAICVTKGREVVYHTTFGAYMTRKKQGVSQIKYLNKKGKSRAGSRVRLASTIQFFEQINTTLSTLFGEYPCDRIAISCSTTLIPYLHQSKVTCPFDKKDPRLYKIPLHLPQANYTNVIRVIEKLQTPRLFWDEAYQEDIQPLLDFMNESE